MIPVIKKQIASRSSTRVLLKKYSIDEINEVIRKMKAPKAKSIVIDHHRINIQQALKTAYQVKGELHRNLWNYLKFKDFSAYTYKEPLVNLRDIKIPPHILPTPPDPWTYSDVEALLQTCPCDIEIQQIRADFNIYFEQTLIAKGVLMPWSCTDQGNESSIMLSMYNIFRLAKCIPFSVNFPWAPAFNNLYDWLMSLNLTAIGFFWANNDSEYSHGWDKWIHLQGNHLGDPIYREIIDSQTGVGIIHVMVLLAHEARHAGYNIPHNCGSDMAQDTDLSFMGAWAVQYYLLKIMAENTGSFFSDYVKQMLSGDANQILNTRFCN